MRTIRLFAARHGRGDGEGRSIGLTVGREVSRGPPFQEELMADEPESNGEEVSRENRYMWIAVGVIILIMAGGMGINMLVHHDTNAATETSAPHE
jgi:hypothetical protein